VGWDASIDRAGNAIAIDGQGPYVAMTAHLDTVIAPRNKDDIAVEPDGRLTGPGVSDNGAGLAALLAIARAWKACPNRPELRRGLLLAANTGEEGEGNLRGMLRLAKDSPLAREIKAFVVVDGADTGHITNRALGSRRFEIAFAGPGGHSWSDYGVGNPVHALCRAVALFSDAKLEGAPKSAFNVGLIEGGSSVNAIAHAAVAKVDIRSESNEKMDELVRALSSAMDRARDIENQRATGGKVTGRIKEIGSRPAAALPEDAAILGYVRAVDAHLGIRSRLNCSSTDANVPLSLGIPAIAIGGGGAGGGAHTSQEWFRPEGRDLGLKRILLVLLLLLREAPTGTGK
jgi:acetylornithine deacetylase/succinyl-diaminopimelate desuccinylase-like protein